MNDITNFRLYIKNVLKQVHPDLKISKDALHKINIYIVKFAIQIRNKLEKYNISKINVECIYNMISISMPGELLKNSIKEANKAVVRYSHSTKNKKTIKEKSGLLFPPSRVNKILNYKSNYDIDVEANIYLAAVLEYIAAEIVNISGFITIESNRIIISLQDVKLAIINDRQMKNLFL